MSDPKERLIRLEEVMSRTALTRSLLYKLMKGGKFSKPVKLAESAVAWPESAIDQWIADRIAAAQQEQSSDEANEAQ